MACKISWTPQAWKTYSANIEYLQTHWTEKEIKTFVFAVEEKLTNLANHPGIGTPRDNKHPNIRHTVIHRRIVLIYRHKPLKGEIELLIFWNTHQYPRNIK